MAPEPNAMEQAVARAVRDNLERIKRTNEELTQAIGDVVAACSSSRPTNALPPMLRAQTAAAALTASMDVLSRFIAMALQSGPRSPLEESITQAISIAAAEAPAAPQRPAPSVPVPQAAAPSVASPAPLEPVEPPSYDLEPTPLPPSPVELEVPGFVGGVDSEFDINRLTPEEQRAPPPRKSCGQSFNFFYLLTLFQFSVIIFLTIKRAYMYRNQSHNSINNFYFIYFYY